MSESSESWMFVDPRKFIVGVPETVGQVFDFSVFLDLLPEHEHEQQCQQHQCRDHVVEMPLLVLDAQDIGVADGLRKSRRRLDAFQCVAHDGVFDDAVDTAIGLGEVPLFQQQVGQLTDCHAVAYGDAQIADGRNGQVTHGAVRAVGHLPVGVGYFMGDRSDPGAGGLFFEDRFGQ